MTYQERRMEMAFERSNARFKQYSGDFKRMFRSSRLADLERISRSRSRWLEAFKIALTYVR